MSWSRSPTIAASSLSDLAGAGVGQRAHLSGEGLELDPELVSLGVPGCCGPCDLGRDRLVAGLHRLDARGQLLRLADLGRDGSLLLLEGVEALRQLVEEPDDRRVRSLGPCVRAGSAFTSRASASSSIRSSSLSASQAARPVRPRR